MREKRLTADRETITAHLSIKTLQINYVFEKYLLSLKQYFITVMSPNYFELIFLIKCFFVNFTMKGELSKII